ncbi:unnamed protein product [Polarella glacialis]|uniref:Nucleotide-diphospho-sugar transferase domain-containing protein n=1 Tax=Polarella glacialis TaxID=89957 RepID=A0A813ES50_POLGL|nr:unnamed protein product [Polarella glacialis]
MSLLGLYRHGSLRRLLIVMFVIGAAAMPRSPHVRERPAQSSMEEDMNFPAHRQIPDQITEPLAYHRKFQPLLLQQHEQIMGASSVPAVAARTAFVALLWGSDPDTLLMFWTLHRSMKDAGMTSNFIALIPEGDAAWAFRHVFDSDMLFLSVPGIPLPASMQFEIARQSWPWVMTKFAVFNMTGYDQVCYLDNDMFFAGTNTSITPEAIFSDCGEAELCMAPEAPDPEADLLPDVCGPGHNNVQMYNAGLMVVRPSKSRFEDLLRAIIGENRVFPLVCQNVINCYMAETQNKVSFSVLGTDWNNVEIIPRASTMFYHFSGVFKPYHPKLCANSGEDSCAELHGVVRRWQTLVRRGSDCFDIQKWDVCAVAQGCAWCGHYCTPEALMCSQAAFQMSPRDFNIFKAPEERNEGSTEGRQEERTEAVTEKGEVWGPPSLPPSLPPSPPPSLGGGKDKLLELQSIHGVMMGVPFDPPKNLFAFLIYSSRVSELINAFAMKESLRENGWFGEIAALLPEGDAAWAFKRPLEDAGILVVPVPQIALPPSMQVGFTLSHWGLVMTKFVIFNMTGYSQICILDTDMIFDGLQFGVRPQTIFSECGEAEFCAVLDQAPLWGQEAYRSESTIMMINGGIMVARPSKRRFQHLMQALKEETRVFILPEQMFISVYLAQPENNMKSKFLDLRWNVLDSTLDVFLHHYMSAYNKAHLLPLCDVDAEGGCDGLSRSSLTWQKFLYRASPCFSIRRWESCVEDEGCSWCGHYCAGRFVPCSAQVFSGSAPLRGLLGYDATGPTTSSSSRTTRTSSTATSTSYSTSSTTSTSTSTSTTTTSTGTDYLQALPPSTSSSTTARLLIPIVVSCRLPYFVVSLWLN